MDNNGVHKEMTVYDLANLMMKGFDGVYQKMDELKNELRGEFHSEIQGLRTDFNKNDKYTDNRLDNIEHRLVVVKNVIEKDLNTPVRW